MNATQPMFLIGGGQDPQLDAVHAAAAIGAAGWWERCGLSEHWPLTTAEAAELLAAAAEYDLDEAGLRDLIGRRLLAAPGLNESGDFEWNPVDVCHAGMLLEAREQWRQTPSGHDAKKHPCQLILEHARAAGQVESVVDGPATPVRFDLRHLLYLLVVSDVREGRAKILALLKAVLEVDHGIIVP